MATTPLPKAVQMADAAIAAMANAVVTKSTFFIQIPPRELSEWTLTAQGSSLNDQTFNF